MMLIESIVVINARKVSISEDMKGMEELEPFPCVSFILRLCVCPATGSEEKNILAGLECNVTLTQLNILNNSSENNNYSNEQ